MSESQNSHEHLFVIETPKQLPTFQLFGKVFHAGSATGGELDLIQSLKTEEKGINAIREQCALINKFLAGREVKKSADDTGWVKTEEPLEGDWVWKTIPTEQLGDLATQLGKAFESQWGDLKSRQQRRQSAKAAKA